jgi:uncharacterized protein
MPRVGRLSIAPVRSLGLQHPTEIELTDRGVVEDRRFFLTNDANRLVDQLTVFKLVQVASRTNPEATTLWMGFPDGTEVDGEVEVAEAVETAIHGRTGVGHRVVGPWDEALTDFVGMPIRVIRCDRPGGTRSGNPASIVSGASVQELAAHAGLDWVDPRRFRMLIDLEDAAAREEDTWLGKRVRIGDAILAVTKPDARCAMTTHDPDTGEPDLDTLRTIISYKGLRDGKNADLGVLADVEQPGRVRVGDEAVLLD